MESGLNTASAVTAIPFIPPWSYTRYLVIDRDVILEALTPKLFRNYMKENKNTDELYIIRLSFRKLAKGGQNLNAAKFAGGDV